MFGRIRPMSALPRLDSDRRTRVARAMHVIERRFDMPGGSLTLKLETEQPLDERDHEAIERIAAECEQYAERHQPARRARTIDTAIDELGGQQGLTAG